MVAKLRKIQLPWINIKHIVPFISYKFSTDLKSSAFSQHFLIFLLLIFIYFFPSIILILFSFNLKIDVWFLIRIFWGNSCFFYFLLMYFYQKKFNKFYYSYFLLFFLKLLLLTSISIACSCAPKDIYLYSIYSILRILEMRSVFSNSKDLNHLFCKSFNQRSQPFILYKFLTVKSALFSYIFFFTKGKTKYLFYPLVLLL